MRVAFVALAAHRSSSVCSGVCLRNGAAVELECDQLHAMHQAVQRSDSRSSSTSRTLNANDPNAIKRVDAPADAQCNSLWTSDPRMGKVQDIGYFGGLELPNIKKSNDLGYEWV